MSKNTELELQNIFLKKGQQKLCEALDISTSEMSRKFKSETGFRFCQLADALDFVGARVVTNDNHVILTKTKYSALLELAREALREE